MNQIKLLKENIERRFGSSIDDVATLKRLMLSINKNSETELSYNTLRRFFGFLPSTKPNINTLNSLSQYLGFKDFHAFSHQLHFPNWETWLYILRLKQHGQITSAVVPVLNSQLKNEYFALYFIDLASHFINQNNIDACRILFEVEIDKMFRSEQLKICLALGLELRRFYKKDNPLIISLIENFRFRRIVLYNFIDYAAFNFGYMELIEQSILIEKEDEHLLFLRLLKHYHVFLNGQPTAQLRLSKSNNLNTVHPIVQGRYYANQLYRSTKEEQQIIFDQLLKHCENLNKSEFFFELIPTILLLKKLDWIAIIFNQYYDDIFEINDANRLTHLGIFQIAQALLFIKNRKYKRAINKLKKVNIDLAFDSYIDYITLFYLIAEYQLNDNKTTIKNQYVQLVNRLGFKVFSLNLLEDYFE